MKIMVLTSRFPYPLEKGDKLRVFHQIVNLAKTNEIVLCSLTDHVVSEAHLSHLRPYCSSIHLFRLSKWLIYPRLLRWFLKGNSIQVGYFTNYFIRRKIRKLVFSEKPDHIYCQLVRMAEYVRDIYHVSKTLDYMDAFSKGMERRAADSPFPFNYVFKRESKLLREYEAKVFYDFDLCTIISEQDREYIKNPYHEQIKVIPNGVNTTDFFFEENSTATVELLFVGNMSYYPNIKAAEYLVQKIGALLNEKGYALQINIAGASPSPLVLGLASEKVEVTGWVDDIVATYHNAKIFVAPLFHGSGLQNKILEAMACGVPVITTTQTNNAIKAKQGEELVLADNAEEFAEAILRLLEDERYFMELRRKARKFVEQNYSWDVFVSALLDEIKKT